MPATLHRRRRITFVPTRQKAEEPVTLEHVSEAVLDRNRRDLSHPLEIAYARYEARMSDLD